MSLSALINRPCTIIRRTASGSVDELGNAVDTDAFVETVCYIEQRSRDEVPEAEWSKASWRAFFLPDAPMFDTGDRVRVDRLGTFEVVGAPWPAEAPLGPAMDHVEATLNKTAGAEDSS